MREWKHFAGLGLGSVRLSLDFKDSFVSEFIFWDGLAAQFSTLVFFTSQFDIKAKG
jgi:hypothetical protein